MTTGVKVRGFRTCIPLLVCTKRSPGTGTRALIEGNPGVVRMCLKLTLQLKMTHCPELKGEGEEKW